MRLFAMNYEKMLQENFYRKTIQSTSTLKGQ